MPLEKEYTFDDLLKLILVKRYMVLGTVIVFSAVAMVVSLISPKVYQAEAVVKLPETPKNGIYPDSKGNIKALINVMETKNLVSQYWKHISDGTTDTIIGKQLIPYLRSIVIEDIKGSTSQFRLVVQVEQNQANGLMAISAVMDHLRNNKYINQRYESEKTNMQNAAAQLKMSIDGVPKLRENALRQIQSKTTVGFNPIEIESEISDLHLKYNELLTDLALFHNYEYVIPPYCSSTPVKPSVVITVLMSAIVGAAVSLITIILQHLIKNRQLK